MFHASISFHAAQGTWSAEDRPLEKTPPWGVSNRGVQGLYQVSAVACSDGSEVYFLFIMFGEPFSLTVLLPVHRCGCVTMLRSPNKTTAVKQWEQRWIKNCLCGGLWRRMPFNYSWWTPSLGGRNILRTVLGTHLTLCLLRVKSWRIGGTLKFRYLDGCCWGGPSIHPAMDLNKKPSKVRIILRRSCGPHSFLQKAIIL